MKKTKIYLLFFCISWLVGCEKRIKIQENEICKEEKVISIMPNEEELHPFDLTPYLDTVKYVKLELTDESTVGAIDKVIVYEDRIYILDMLTSSLFIFDMKGHYLHKIAKRGQGPGEYIQLDFFDIDRDNKQIVLTDLMAYWIMRYDMNGYFLYKQKIPIWCEGVSVLPNGGIVLYSNFRNNSYTLNQEYNLIYLDSAMQFKQAYFPYNISDLGKIKITASFSGQFYFFEDHLNFSFPSGSTVYQITSDSLVNKYQFDFGKNILSIENPSNTGQFTNRLKNGKYNGFSSSIMENDRLIFFSMHSDFAGPLMYKVYYSKESGNKLTSFLFTLEGNYYSDFFKTGYGSWIVSEIEASSLLSWEKSFPKEKIPIAGKFTKAALSFAKNLTEEDNSVLMFYKLKPF